MKFKRAVSLIVALVMICSAMLVPVSAKETAGVVATGTISDYVADYDRDTPVIIVHGMSQNDTYVLDENGEKIESAPHPYMSFTAKRVSQVRCPLSIAPRPRAMLPTISARVLTPCSVSTSVSPTRQ